MEESGGKRTERRYTLVPGSGGNKGKSETTEEAR